ncbi:MAG: hypothetical protein LBI38_06830 [Oscillospiraceae bacterium]|jgi:hypothetical protein|nr:hypothetical protein [Oscillospiraceae bacterium]
MNISKVIDTSMTNHANIPKTAQQDTQKKSTTLAADNVDKYDANTAAYNANYNAAANRTENLNVQAYKGGVKQIKNALFQDYVNFNFGKQSGVSINRFFEDFSFNPSSFAVNAFNAAEATSEKHADYWSADAVAERIFTFAKTLAGENDELFSTMKNAFLKGFKLAEGSRGGTGKLPDISYQTKEKVLSYFDDWEKEINGKKAAAAGESAPTAPAAGEGAPTAPDSRQ